MPEQMSPQVRAKVEALIGRALVKTWNAAIDAAAKELRERAEQYRLQDMADICVTMQMLSNQIAALRKEPRDGN